MATICRVIFKLAAQAARVPVYPASAQTRRTWRQARWVFHSSGRAASRSWTEAAVMTTSRIRPVASTAMCRLRPLTFLALSQPRLAFGHGVSGPDGLRVNDRGGGLNVASGGGPGLGTQLAVQPG